MWIRLWVAFSVSTTVLSQQTSTRVHQSGAGYEWGWQLTPGTGPGNVGAVGQYFVKLPESEQRVLYTADGNGYYGAAALNATTHSSSFALGEKAIELYARQPAPNLQQNSQQAALHSSRNAPVDIYLLQQQLSAPISTRPEPFTILTSATNALQLPNYFYKHLTPLYNIQTQHPVRKNENSEQIESSKPLRQEAKTEQTFVTPVVQVFKDHNCSDDKNHPDNVSHELEGDLKKSKDLFAEVQSYELRDINGNFGVRNKIPYSYRGQVSFKVETPRPNARNERFYHTTEATSNTPVYNATQEGINRLVASTQDLITNEDLLRINNAIEHHLRVQNDDLIKPRGRLSARNQHRNSQETLDASPTTITVKAKIANILRGEIEQTENNPVSERVLESDSNEYKFSSPIIVAETPDNNVNKQMFDNVLSTVVPYLENGYEVVAIKNSPQETQQNIDNGDDENFINVTPRPIGANYLAPITVALRLLNSNDNDTFNYVNDHEAADSELVTDTVEKPNKEKTFVEVQESIPLSITHINDVEVHEYLDEGRSNDKNKGAYEFAKNLYDNYVESVRSSKKIQDNMNKILLYQFGTMNSEENTDNHQDNNDNSDSKEQLEPSENIQSQVEISPNGENNQRSEQVYYSDDNYGSDNQKIIQPIIIEKEVPVTKFVDRYIEKQVPYTETVTVPVPVDRPVPYAVQVEKIVEKPVHVTKYVDKPYPVEIPRPYPVEVKVPYPVQQKVYVDRPVHVPYPVEKVVEKQVVQPVPVPTPVGVPVEVPYPVEQKIFYPFPVDRPVPVHIEVEKPVERIVEKEVRVPYPVEKRVPYPVPYETKVPVPYPVERRVPVPVDRIVEKPVTVTQVVEKPVHIQVPVPHPVPVHVHHPYPVDRIVEKKVPYPVHIDRIVEKKVNVPYPVEKIVEKIVEKPVVVTKYVNKPYPVEVKVPYPVEKIVEKKVPYAVHVPVEVKVPYKVENSDKYQVSYRYGYKPYEADETRNILQYQLLDQNEQKQRQYNNLKTQYEQYVKDFQNPKKSPQTVPTQSTHWGNQYASSYQYINNSVPDIRQQDWKKKQAFKNYVDYITKPQHQNPYYAQSQRQNQGESQYNGQIQNQYNGQSHEQSQYNGQNQYNGQSQEQSQYNSQSHGQNQHNSQYHGQNQHNSQYHGQNQHNSQSHVQNQHNSQPHGQNQHYSQSHGQSQHYSQPHGPSQNNGQIQGQNQYSNQNQKDYYAQAQSQNHNTYWNKNKNYLVEVKVRRTDRVPKVTIEYGGFKPPLIPSTEVDLDGVPVKQSE